MARSFIEGKDEGIGKGEFANLPQEKYMALYPKVSYPTDEGIDDTMVDIDDITNRSEKKRRSNISNQK